MLNNQRTTRNDRGLSLPEMLIGLCITMLVLGATICMHRVLALQLQAQGRRADAGNDAARALAVIVRDLRNAGANPAGMAGLSAGTPLPLSHIGNGMVEVQGDFNADGDTNDALETVRYTQIGGTLIRTVNGKNSIFLNNVGSFKLIYELASGATTENPIDPTTVRKVQLTLSVAVNDAKGKPHPAVYSSEVTLRNFH